MFYDEFDKKRAQIFLKKAFCQIPSTLPLSDRILEMLQLGQQRFSRLIAHWIRVGFTQVIRKIVFDECVSLQIVPMK